MIFAIIILPLIVHLLGAALCRTFPNQLMSIRKIEGLVLVISTFALLALVKQTEFATASPIEFFKISLSLPPFKMSMVCYLVGAYALSIFVDKEQSGPHLISEVLTLSFAQALIMAQNFYALFVFCTGMTLCLLISTRHSTAEVRLNSVYFYLRKELSDFFLIMGLLLLSFNLVVHDFISLEQMELETSSLTTIVAIILVSMWFFIRLRIFPFISFRQSFLRSVGGKSQILFMSIYLPAIALTYSSFSAPLIDIGHSNKLLMWCGAISVCIYSLLSLFSRKIETALNFLIYAHYSLIPLAMALGIYQGFAYHLVYMCGLVSLMYYFTNSLRQSGSGVMERMGEFKESCLPQYIGLASVLLLLIGLPFVGLYAFKYEMLWGALNRHDASMVKIMALTANLLLVLPVLRFLLAMLKTKDATNKVQISLGRLLGVIAIVVVAWALGTINLPTDSSMSWPVTIKPYIATAVVDARIFFLPQWASYLLILSMLLLPLSILGLGLWLNSKRTAGFVTIVSEQRLTALIENYSVARRKGYFLLKGASLFSLINLTIAVSWLEKRMNRILHPFVRGSVLWARSFNRLEVVTFHGHMLSVLFALIAIGLMVVVIIHQLGGVK